MIATDLANPDNEVPLEETMELGANPFIQWEAGQDHRSETPEMSVVGSRNRAVRISTSPEPSPIL